jgi:hypothetical protein
LALERPSVPADGPSRSALMRSWVLKAKLITLTQPENFRLQLAACGKAKKFSDRKIAVRLARHCRRQAKRRNDLRLLRFHNEFYLQRDRSTVRREARW